MNELKIVFSKIKKGEIFEDDFINLTENNGTIEFKKDNGNGGIAVIYAPNGTGKTSLTEVLSQEISSNVSSFIAKDEVDGNIKPETKAFHIIKDQIDRNVIHGKTTDYLVGAQIKREYELKDRLNEIFKNAYKEISAVYKKEFRMSKVSSAMLNHVKEIIGNEKQYKFIRSIVNVQEHGKNIDREEFLGYIRNIANRPNIIELEDEKRQYIIEDMAKNEVINKILDICPAEVKTEPQIVLIEQQGDAIKILKKYSELDNCIVCDRHISNTEELLQNKIEKNKSIYDNLNEKTKNILDEIVNDDSLSIFDPFDVKNKIRDFISGQDMESINVLKQEFLYYIKCVCDEIVTKLFDSFAGTGVLEVYDEYKGLVETQPVLDSEELMFIENVISENIGKKIRIIRSEDSDKNYVLKIGNQELLGTDRKDFELSTGEQNFVSLSFELLLAKHSDKRYVVIDDPISSFDSIYKNKIAYCLKCFLSNKRQIILTHNTDLIRLLKAQAGSCFNLYILNNTENGENGFIHVSNKERDLLIDLHKLVGLFQSNELLNLIKDKRQFLMAMIPFIRGYAHISLDKEGYYGKLSGIMHGYGNGEIDVALVYNYFFGEVFEKPETISVKDILEVDLDNIEVLDRERVPLLADTLEQTLIYYHIRMLVEKELAEIFDLQVKDGTMLGQIIGMAFECDESDENYETMREYRVFFASRKTLLNEFNHFEGNMNIFQPAIDIKKEELKKEVRDIEKKLVELKEYVGSI